MTREEVRVEMRVDHELDRDAVLLRRLDVLLDVAPGVDDDRATCALVSYEVGSLREAVEIELLEDHAFTHPRRRRRGYPTAMSDFAVPSDLTFNRAPIADPAAFAEGAGASSWLFLCGEEFAAMDGGMSYDQVQAAVPESENIVSDPPRELTMDLAKRHMAAIDRLPRPTLVTCRAGPRSSAVVYLYSGLQ